MQRNSAEIFMHIYYQFMEPGYEIKTDILRMTLFILVLKRTKVNRHICVYAEDFYFLKLL